MFTVLSNDDKELFYKVERRISLDRRPFDGEKLARQEIYRFHQIVECWRNGFISLLLLEDEKLTADEDQMRDVMMTEFVLLIRTSHLVRAVAIHILAQMMDLHLSGEALRANWVELTEFCDWMSVQSLMRELDDIKNNQTSYSNLFLADPDYLDPYKVMLLCFFEETNHLSPEDTDLEGLVMTWTQLRKLLYQPTEFTL